MKAKVLFICVHNSARSQMAEAWANELCGETLEAHSAGFQPGVLNPLVVQAMLEEGIDISHKGTQSVFEVYKSGKAFSYVISVCDQANAEKCPVFPGVARRLDWSFPDPSAFEGQTSEKMAKVREVREAIKAKVEEWCAEVCPDHELM